MIKQKIGVCAICGLQNKNLMAKKCFEEPNFCYQKAQKEKYLQNKNPKVKKPVKKISDKQIALLAEYRKLRDIFLKENSMCQYPNCKSRNVELHHKRPRKFYLCDVSVFMSVCRVHHNHIHNNCKEAYEMEYLIKSI